MTMSISDTIFNLSGDILTAFSTFVQKMKATELLRIGTQILSLMSKNDIMRDDYKYLDVFESFRNMRSNRVKYRSAIKMLADENNVSERTLERIFKRLSKDI